ncbi:hypothetical protein BH23THE1_BH23THE1_20760 [soil metagenome]
MADKDPPLLLILSKFRINSILWIKMQKDFSYKKIRKRIFRLKNISIVTEKNIFKDIYKRDSASNELT